MKKNKNKKISKLQYLNYILMGLAIVDALLLLVIFVKTKDFYAISPNVYLNMMGILAILIIIILFLTGVGLKYQDKIIKIIALVIASLALVILVYGSYIATSLSNSMNKISEQSGEVQKETISASFVVYDNEEMTSLDDIANKTVGILSTTDTNSAATIGKNELEKENISVTYVEYNNYNDLFLGLVDGDVDVAILQASYASTFEENDGYQEYIDKTSVITTVEEEVELEANESANKDISIEPFTVLLIGYAGNGDELSDSMILASINPSTMKASLTSIARDSYVPIACYVDNSYDKLTHARAVSRDCTINTIEDLLDTNIDFYAEVNFQGVVDIVDALGGIQIDSPVEFVGQTSSTTRGTYTVWVNKGVQIANGEQALAFARERYAMPNGDFDREMNQQAVIKEIVSESLALKDINAILDVINAASDNLTTNMSSKQITQLLNYLLTLDTPDDIPVDDIIQIENSRITGYSAWTYNYSMSLPLWCYPLYQGSIADNKAIIDDTLGITTETQKTSFSYDSDLLYFSPSRWSETYNEAHMKIDMPDYILNFLDGNYTIDEAISWANSVGQTLIAEPIYEGDQDYDDSLADGYIISQSVKYGTLVSDADSLTLRYISKLTEEEMIPDFIGKDYTEYNSWKANNGYSGSITWINSNDENYVADNVGKIVSQSIAAKENKANYTELNVSAYDAPYVTGYSSLTTKTAFTTWATANLSNEVTYKYVYSDTADNANTIKTVTWTNPISNSDSKMKANSLVTVTLYTDDITYAQTYTVTFIYQDENGNEKTIVQEVIDGEPATPPALESGYKWDSEDYNKVTNDLTITAISDNTDSDTEDTGSDTEDTGSDTGNTGSEGDTGSDTEDTGSNTGDTGSDTGGTGSDTGGTGSEDENVTSDTVSESDTDSMVDEGASVSTNSDANSSETASPSTTSN